MPKCAASDMLKMSDEFLVCRWLFCVDSTLPVWGHAVMLVTYLAEEMTTECCSELRIFVRWAATESS